MIVGIVGSEEAKFTSVTQIMAKHVIRNLLEADGVTGVCSGACHLGGVDVWAEEIGKQLGLNLYIFPPASKSWEQGYKPRNIKIAQTSDIVHCITLERLPESYKGMRFKLCYHCNTDTHVKSGGCWTARYAMGIGKKAAWHVLQDGCKPILADL